MDDQNINKQVRKFRLEECQQLKAEVLKLSDMLASLTQWMVAGLAAVITWLILNGFGKMNMDIGLQISQFCALLGLVAALRHSFYVSGVIAFLVAWRRSTLEVI